MGNPRLEELKQFFIQCKNADEVSQEKSQELYQEIIDHLHSPQDRILATDVLSIWLLRASQISLTINFQENGVSQLIEYLWDHIDMADSGLVNASVNLLKRLIQYGLKNGKVQELTSCLRQKLDRLAQKDSFLFLETMAKESVMFAENILQNDPNFVRWVVATLQENATANAASKALVAVIGHFENSYNLWCEDVISGLNDSSTYLWCSETEKELYLKDPRRKNRADNILTYLLPLLFRQDHLVIKPFVQKSLTLESKKYLRILSLSQSVLATGDIVELGLVTEKNLFDYVTSNDPETRIEALTLMVSSMKSSRMTAPYVLRFFTDSVVLDAFTNEAPTPEIRGAFSSVFRKFILSLRENLMYYRKSSKRSHPAGFPENAEEQFLHIFLAIRSYIINLVSPDSSYSQLLIAFDALQLFVEEEFDGVCRNKRPKKAGPVPHIFNIFDKKLVNTLLKFTTNNYLDIRDKAKNILHWAEDFPSFKESPYKEMLANSISELTSLKGRNSDATVDLLLVISEKSNQEDFLALTHLLMEHIQAQRHQSLHGFFAIFARLLNSDFYGHTNISHLKEISDLLIDSCFEQWQRYKDQTTFETLEDNDDISGCSWRSIREGGFLMKALIEENVRQSWGAFLKSRFVQLCELMIEQLSSVTHRGVFTAIFDSFVVASTLCLKDQELAGLPRQWLDINLALVRRKTQFVSRRSAGLPILIIGVLNAFATTGNLEEMLLHTMTELFNFARLPFLLESSQKTDVPQVHAFNCIKQIFLDPVLWPSAQGYMQDALELSITNLGHKEWSIKNGALMLFTALQNRIFGTNKQGNSMSGIKASILFSKYGLLEELLYAELDKATGGSVDVAIPILNLLSRADDLDRVKKLKFMPILGNSLLVHKSWKVRELTAKVLARRVTLQTHTDSRIAYSLDVIRNNIDKANTVHGQLFYISEISQRYEVPLLDLAEELFNRHQWLALCKLVEFTNIQEIKNLVGQALIDFICGRPVLDGTKKLFLRTAAPLLLEAESPENVEDLSLLLLESGDIDFQQVAIQFWSKKNCDDKIAQCLETLVRQKATFISCRIGMVNLLSQWERPLSGEIPDASWSRELQLQLIPTKPISTSAISELLAWSQSDDARLAGVRAASLSLQKNSDQDLLLLIMWSLHDAEEDVRNECNKIISLHMGVTGTCSNVFHQGLKAFKAKYSSSFEFSKVVEKLLFLADEDLLMFEQQVESVFFDIERDNLHINEVAAFEQFVDVVKDFALDHSIVERRLSLQLERVEALLSSSEKFILCWGFEVHFFTAVRKIRALSNTFGVCQEGIPDLQKQLELMLYF